MGIGSEEKKIYYANNLANRILRDFGREFAIDMSPFMESQIDRMQDHSIDRANTIEQSYASKLKIEMGKIEEEEKEADDQEDLVMGNVKRKVTFKDW